MSPDHSHPVLPETAVDGFVYGAVTPLGEPATAGAGFLRGPDGSRCGLRWEMADSPYIMKLDGPGSDHWGVFQVGFTTPVHTAADLKRNLEALIPKLKILYARARIH